MRAPINKRSNDEIVADIIKLVKCPPTAAPLVQRIIRRLINDLRTAPEPFSGSQKKNVEFAEKLYNEITKLEHTLKSAPNSFILSVLFEERFWQLWWNAQESIIAINANTKRYIAEERARQNRFAEDLARLRAQCNRVISREPGEHGSTKHQHAHAAKASFVLLAAIHTSEKLRLTCSPTSKFVRLASLLHEAATDEYDADLLRACKAFKADLDAKK